MRVAGATRQDANNIDQMKESTQIGEKGECTLQKKNRHITNDNITSQREKTTTSEHPPQIKNDSTNDKVASQRGRGQHLRIFCK